MAKSRSTAGTAADAYTGMLWLSLIATITGIVFLFLDYQDYSGKQVPNLKSMTPPNATAPQLDGGAPAGGIGS